MLSRELADSPAGQELLATGRAAAFAEMFMLLLPKQDPALTNALKPSSLEALAEVIAVRIAQSTKGETRERA